MTEITVMLAEGASKVEGNVVGAFGVHRGVGAESGWAVTHLRSGRRTSPKLYYCERNATNLASTLNALGIDWDFDAPRSMGFRAYTNWSTPKNLEIARTACHLWVKTCAECAR